MILSVNNLSFSYHQGAEVLKDVSFEVHSGEFLSVLGPNGVGKSTLFRCLLGVLSGYRGEIRVGGSDIRTLPPRSGQNGSPIFPRPTPQPSATAFWIRF